MLEQIQLGTINTVSVHRVGNKSAEEGVIYSEKPLFLSGDLYQALSCYFDAPAKTPEYYDFYHPSSLPLNETYGMVKRLFEEPDNHHQYSKTLADLLYSCSTHPNIKGGDFYAVRFENCLFQDELVTAIGLFKSEGKDTFLKVSDELDVRTDQGVSIDKLDKGAIVFDIGNEYVVSVVDQTNKNNTLYWVDDFLQLKEKETDYYHTREMMNMVKSFLTKELPSNFEVEIPDISEYQNRSLEFFRQQEDYNMEDFEAEVIIQPEVIEQFRTYRNDYQDNYGMTLPDEFSISSAAVKRKQSSFKSVLKLDKNFSVYIHGDRSMIEKGEEDGRKFYKLFYHEER